MGRAGTSSGSDLIRAESRRARIVSGSAAVLQTTSRVPWASSFALGEIIAQFVAHRHGPGKKRARASPGARVEAQPKVRDSGSSAARANASVATLRKAPLTS